MKQVIWWQIRRASLQTFNATSRLQPSFALSFWRRLHFTGLSSEGRLVDSAVSGNEKVREKASARQLQDIENCSVMSQSLNGKGSAEWWAAKAAKGTVPRQGCQSRRQSPPVFQLADALLIRRYPARFYFLPASVAVALTPPLFHFAPWEPSRQLQADIEGRKTSDTVIGESSRAVKVATLSATEVTQLAHCLARFGSRYLAT